MFFSVFLILVIAQIIDSMLGSMADILKDFTVSVEGLALFLIISLIYCFGQYFILGMVKAKNREKEIRKLHFNVLEKIVRISQYVLLTILILVILQMTIAAEYSTFLLRVAVFISSGLALYVMSFLSYSLFTWFRSNIAIVVLLYGLASAFIAIYIICVAVIFDMALQEKPAMITPQTEITFSEIPPWKN